MTAALLVGVGFGTGLLLVLAGLRPAPVPLAAALAELERHRPSLPDDHGPAGARAERLLGHSWLASPAGRRVTERAAPDLRVAGMTPAGFLTQRVAVALTALLWAPATAALMTVAGVGVPVVLPVWCSVALAPIGFLYPGLRLRARAQERRRTFRHALSAFLDVVAVSLAAGRGVESALYDASQSGKGWAFDELRQALLEARLLGEAPWAGLGRLGTDLGIPELRELAASAALAGAEGARVRASLAARARAMRQRSLADVEAAAQSASERMSVPVVLLLLGFIVFLGYPALQQVMGGL